MTPTAQSHEVLGVIVGNILVKMVDFEPNSRAGATFTVVLLVPPSFLSVR